MPLYFFNTTGPDGDCRDEGSALSDSDAAGCLARRSLCEIAGDRCSGTDPIAYTVRVRDPMGLGIYEATLTLIGTRS